MITTSVSLVAAEMMYRYWTGPNEPTDPHLPGITYWNDSMLPDWLLELLDKSVSLVEFRQLHHRSNIVRWWLLHEFGGIWLDYDIDPTQPFPDLPFCATGINHDSACVCCMGFPAHHPVPTLALDCLITLPSGRSSVEVSGDWLLHKCLDATNTTVTLFDPVRLT